MPEPQDLDALAAKYGGQTEGADLDALAAKHGGAAVAAKTDATTQEPGFLEPHKESGIGSRAQEFGRGALAGTVTPIAHPVNTLEGMGRSVIAAGMGGSGYPTLGMTGNRERDLANIQNQEETGQQAAREGGQMLREHPAYMAGSLIGPPIIAAGANVVGGMAMDAMKPYAPRLYQSALKPPPSIDPGLRSAAIQTGLQERIPVTESGLEKLYGKNDVINQRIADVIGANPERTIDPTAVSRRVNQIRPTFENQVNPAADLASLNRSQSEFMEKHTENRPFTKIEFRPIDQGEVGAVPTGPGVAKVPKAIPGPEAQAEKIGTYKQLRGKYGELSSADVESQKALARGLKEGIAQQYPEVEPLNAREGRLLTLEPMLERAVGRIGNKDIGGIGTPLFGAGLKAVGASTPATVVGTLAKSVFGLPAVKSNMAISLANRGLTPETWQSHLSRALPPAAAGSASTEDEERRRREQANGQNTP